MPLSIAAIACVGISFSLSWTAVLRLGASLAPTDPVLASDVQVAPSQTGGEDEVRFGLASKAGVNNGFAFPDVHLAVRHAALAPRGAWLAHWLTVNVVWKIGIGILAGWLTGLLSAGSPPTFPAPASAPRPGRLDRRRSDADYLGRPQERPFLWASRRLHLCPAATPLVSGGRLPTRNARRRRAGRAPRDDRRVALGGALVSSVLSLLTWGDAAFAALVLIVVCPLAGIVGVHLAGLSVANRHRGIQRLPV